MILTKMTLLMKLFARILTEKKQKLNINLSKKRKMTTVEEKIIIYFRTERENSVPTISKVFGIPQWKVHKIIDKYLKEGKQIKK